MMERLENDAYYTEHGVIEALMRECSWLLSHHRYFDPCAGNGQMAMTLHKLLFEAKGEDACRVLAADLYSDNQEVIPGFDASQGEAWHSKFANHCPDVTITNPPFKDACAIAENALLYSTKSVALLLRLSFLEPCRDRAAFLKAYSDNLVCIVPISPRPKFRTDTKGSDSVTVAWFVWDKEFSWNKVAIPSPFRFVTDWRG